MDFAKDISEFTAPQIVKALECPRSTAYAWLDGKRQPPVWQQKIFLEIVRRKGKRKTD
jgi:hypothetical protein